MKKTLPLLLLLLTFFVGCAQTPAESEELLIYVHDVTEAQLTYDLIEWLDATADAARLRELGVDPNALPNGYYIYNPAVDNLTARFTDKTAFEVIDWTKDGAEHAAVSISSLYTRISAYGRGVPWIITVSNGQVLSMREVYIP